MIGATLILSVGALWYLSREEEIVFDPKVHTLEKLRKIMRSYYAKCTATHCKHLNLLLNMKHSGELTQEFFDNLYHSHKNEIGECETQTYKDFGVNEYFFNEWLQKFEKDPEISRIITQLKNLDKMVFSFDNPRIDVIECKDIPTMPRLRAGKLPNEKVGERIPIDEEMYLQIFRKQLAVFRHKLYKLMKSHKSEEKSTEDLQEEMAKLQKEKSEVYDKVFALYDVRRAPGDERDAMDLFQEIFLYFYSKSLQPLFNAKPEDREFLAPNMHKRRDVETKEHMALVTKILDGNEPMPQLEKDPLLTTEADISMDLRGFDGYTLKSTGTFI